MYIMKTLIELYDDIPFENVLGTEMFEPERTVFLCGTEVAQDPRKKKVLENYFLHRGLKTRIEFVETSIYRTDRLMKRLEAVISENPDCAVDITGGTDAALFACGKVCSDMGIPVFTYSRKKNSFYDINQAPFADQLACDVRHSIEDCFMMAGGALRVGRVDNSALKNYMDVIDPFFRVYMSNRRSWPRTVQYFQRSSQTGKTGAAPLSVESKTVIKGDSGRKISVPADAMADLKKLDFLTEYSINGDKVKYRYKDQQIRSWLRDNGSVLELYVYKACVESGIFNDVVTSAIVDWEGTESGVTNEVDVMAMHGTCPVFISCKTCAITTEAINELAVLRDRFGGKGAKAAIVSTQPCSELGMLRATDLGIDIITYYDLKNGRLSALIRSLVQ